MRLVCLANSWLRVPRIAEKGIVSGTELEAANPDA